jgi:thiol-disulfide isomerase/thioredoxin
MTRLRQAKRYDFLARLGYDKTVSRQPEHKHMNDKGKLITLFVFTVLMILAVLIFKPKPEKAENPDTGRSASTANIANINAGSPASDMKTHAGDVDFSGIRRPEVAEIRKVLPAVMNKPMLVEFKSKFCLDCKKMAPELARVLEQHPEVQPAILDIHEDRKTQPVVFEVFKPTTVPLLVFINRGGAISHIAYGYSPPKEIAAQINRLSSSL